MKILRYVNPAVTATATTLSAAAASQDTDLEFTSATGFSADDFILIEAVGCEKFEIRKISSISSTTITLTSAISLAHASGVTVTKLNYDQYRIDYSSNGTDYTTGTLTDLNYAEQWNDIYYEDINRSDVEYFRIYYYNSHSTTAALQSTVTPTEVYYGYIKYTDFIAKNGIDVTNSGITRAECENAIIESAEEIKRMIYRTRFFETYSQDTIFDLNLEGLELADSGLSKGTSTIVVDKYDIILWQEDVKGFRIYKGDKIAKVFKRRTSRSNTEAKVEVTESLPTTSDYKLHFQVDLFSRELPEIKEGLKEINSLLAINHLFTTIPFERLQYGMAGWSSGGTSTNFDQNMMQTLIENNNKRIRQKLATIRKISFNSSTFQEPTTASMRRFSDTLRWS